MPILKENKMKKTNLIAALAVIAVSATSLMAHQLAYTTPDKETLKEVTASVQYGVNDANLSTQQQNIIESINEDINSVTKYQNLLADYNRFLALMNNESLAAMNERYVDQTIFMTIDDLAHSILNLPEHAKPYYIKAMTESKYNFKYTGKTVTLKDLFEMSKDAVTTQYARDNSSIAKIFEKHQTIKETTTHSFWQEFFESFVRGAQLDK